VPQVSNYIVQNSRKCSTINKPYFTLCFASSPSCTSTNKNL